MMNKNCFEQQEGKSCKYMETRKDPIEKMDLIRLEEIMKKNQPDSIFYDEDGWTATTEWLIGTFAGVGFTNETIEESIKEMCEYLTKHINHQSVVGNIVTKSGFPDLDKVEKYLNTEQDEMN